MKIFFGLIGSAIYLLIFYYIIKIAVRDGISEAYKNIEKNKNS